MRFVFQTGVNFVVSRSASLSAIYLCSRNNREKIESERRIIEKLRVSRRRDPSHFLKIFNALVSGGREGSRMVRQQPEFIYRETARHLITRPFRWFHYPLALSFHKDINSPSCWLLRVKLYPGLPRGVLLKSGGRRGEGEGGRGWQKIFEKIRRCSSINSCQLNDPYYYYFEEKGG